MGRKVLKRILIIFLVAVFSTVVIVYSSKPKVTKAVEPVSIGFSIIAALSAFMAAGGVSMTANNIGNNSDLANAWERASDGFSYDGKTLQDWYQNENAVDWIVGKDNKNKTLLMSTGLSQWFAQFRNWFTNNFALTDSGETTVVSNNYFESPVTGEKFVYYPSLSGLSSSNVPISLCTIAPNATYQFALDENRIFRCRCSDISYSYNYYRIRVYFELLNGQGVVTGTANHQWARSAPENFKSVKVIFYKNSSNNLAFGGVPDDGGSYQQPYSLYTSIPVSSLTTGQIGLTGSLTDGYDDFAQALEDAQTQAGDGTDAKIGIDVGDVAVDQPLTKERITNAFLDRIRRTVATGELVGGYEGEKEAEDELDGEKAPTAAEIGSNIIVIDGLHRFFPFCIPWDLYDLIEKLNVDPVAPEFDLEIGFAGLFEEQTIHIDFSPFETAALIMRVLIVIGFALFLIIKTRDLIRG